MIRTLGRRVEPYVLDENEAAIFMGVSRKTLQGWRTRRMGPPYIRIARRCIRYRRDDLRRYMDERVVAMQRRR